MNRLKREHERSANETKNDAAKLNYQNGRAENAFLYLTHTIEKHLRFISLSSSSFTLFLHPLHFNASSWNSCIGIAGFVKYKAILTTTQRTYIGFYYKNRHHSSYLRAGEREKNEWISQEQINTFDVFKNLMFSIQLEYRPNVKIANHTHAHEKTGLNKIREQKKILLSIRSQTIIA